MSIQLRSFQVLCLFVSLSGLLCSAAMAQANPLRVASTGSSALQQEENRLGEISLGAALWNVFDDADRSALHLAYLHRPLNQFYDIQPGFLIIYADEGQHYYSLGVHKQLYRYAAFSLSVSFHAGLVDSPEALGDNIEFYSALNAGYQLNTQWTLALEIGHISNGGLGETNPGSEGISLHVRYQL